MISLGQRIKQARQAYGYTQNDIANKLGCSLNTVSRWEHDKFKPSTEDISKLEKLLDCSLDNVDADALVNKVSSLEMQLEDIRLELISAQKSRNRVLLASAVIFVVMILIFIIVILSFNWIDPNDKDQPVRVVEYYYIEEGEELYN